MINLQPLFKKQAELDAHIEKEHPRQPGEDRLAKKILALQVELGELANEWRGFKFWSKDQEPRTTIKCEMCDGLGNDIYFTGSERDGTLQENSEPCGYCDGMGNDDSENPLLEEYVDCLHFILSIGLEIKIDYSFMIGNIQTNSPEGQFIETFDSINAFYRGISLGAGMKPTRLYYEMMLDHFIGLGDMLGFTWEEVEQAYDAKNAINHERQQTSY